MSSKAGKILNHKTGRYVSRTGKIGKSIIQKQRKRPLPKTPKRRKVTSKKGCPSGKVFNPRSGRCVSRKGKIGTQIVRKSKFIDMHTGEYGQRLLSSPGLFKRNMKTGTLK